MCRTRLPFALLLLALLLLVRWDNPGPRDLQPLWFEANAGQISPEYSFIASDHAGFVLIAPAKLVFGKGKDAIQVAFRGASHATVTGVDRQSGHVNYLIGRDPSRWIKDVDTYGRVRARGLYPGIDVLYYGNHGSVESDFLVAPGADPHRIRFGVEGSRGLDISRQGDLVIKTPTGLVRFYRPVVYQQTSSGRHMVSARYRIVGPREFGFELARYDRSRPLIVDPVLSYATFLGGSGNESGTRIAADSQGNTYMVGATTSSDYPTTPGALSPPRGRFNDVVITKLNPKTGLVYSTHLGGTKDDLGFGIAVDGQGQAYVTGSTSSTDFPLVGAFQKTYGGVGDAFVTKLNAAGNGIVYSTYLGGAGTDAGMAIAIDSAGNAYVTGATSSAKFPTMNPLQANLAGGKGGSGQPFFTLGDVFVTKLDPTGSKLVYSTYYGGSDDEASLGIAVDSTGAVYVAGFTTSTNFPLKNALQSKYGGTGGNGVITTGDAFVFKLTPDGSQAVYSTYLGGNQDDMACGIAVDTSGNAYVVGNTFSSNFPLAAAAQATYGGATQQSYFRITSGDAFVAKINASGSALTYSTFLGGSDDDRALGVAVDNAGNAYVVGNTASSNFPVSSDAQQKKLGGVGTVSLSNLLPGGYVKAPVGFGDAFLAQYDPAGKLAYATYLGGSDDDVAAGVALDPQGNIYLTGNTASANFPTAGSAFQSKFAGLAAQDATGSQLTSLAFGDAFIAIFQGAAQPAVTVLSAVNGADYAPGIAPDELISVFGTNLASGPQFPSSLNLPTSLIGTTVTFTDSSGHSAPAPLAYVSTGQVNCVVPSGLAAGNATVTVQSPSGASSAFAAQVGPVAPGIFSADSTGKGLAAAQIVRVTPDGAQTTEFTTSVNAQGQIVPVPIAFNGDSLVLVLYATGVQHRSSLSNVKVQIGPMNLPADYAGPQNQFEGLDQINVSLPTSLADSGTVTINVSVDGVNANPVTVAFQ